MVAAIGVSQQRLVSNAILAVETGQADAVLVLGGEAKASALTARRTGAPATDVTQGPGGTTCCSPGESSSPERRLSPTCGTRWCSPRLIDSALARTEDRSPGQLPRRRVRSCWPASTTWPPATRRRASPTRPHRGELATTTDDNRLLAFPYNKWHSTQWAVDHAAALLICTEDVAHRHGEADDRILFPLVALDTSWGLALPRRAEPHRWPMMQHMGHHAGVHLGGPVGDADLLEIYSCFPAAVRVQQRELALPVDGTPTVLGGMAFAGGPFNHFTYMATAELARRLRGGADDDVAVLTTVSGLLTKAGLMAWGREPHPEGALVADIADEVAAATAEVDVADFDETRAIMSGDRVVAATVTGGLTPRLIALADDPGGVRHIVTAPAPDGDPADALANLSS